MKIVAIAMTSALVAAAAANAATVTYSGGIALATTNWSQNPTLPQFDNTAGGSFDGFVLTGVELTLTGTVNGDIKFESLDAAPATVNYSISANMTIAGPGGANGIALPVAGGSFNATAFDGNQDFGGTSGATFVGLTNTDSTTATPFIFAPYIGNSTIALTVAATGTSGGSGAGNLIQQFATNASAEYSVKYTYEPVPAPAAAALLGLGGLIAGRRRRA